MSLNSPSPIDIYYATNYTKCPKNTSFIASWQGLALFAHISAGLLLPLYIYGGYCIVKVTPTVMKATKWYLFNLHFWVCYADILLLTLITPYFFFPAFAGFPAGIFRMLQIPTSVQVYIGIVSVMLMGLSVVAVFESRFTNVIKTSSMITKLKRMLFYGVQILIILVYLLPVYSFTPNQEQAKYLFLSMVPCPTEEYFYAPVYFFVHRMSLSELSGPAVFLSSIGGFSIILGLEVVLFCCGCVYNLFVSNVVLSKNTRKLQRNFFYGSVLQVTIPVCFVFVPALIFALMNMTRYYNQELSNSCTLALSTHGLMSTLVMIGIYKPYRTHTIDLILRRTQIEPNDHKVSTFHILGRLTNKI